MAKRCAELGIECIDLGKGDERYKQSLQSGTTELYIGAADSRPLHAAARRVWFGALAWGRESRFRELLKLPKRVLERVRGDAIMRQRAPVNRGFLFAVEIPPTGRARVRHLASASVDLFREVAARRLTATD